MFVTNSTLSTLCRVMMMRCKARYWEMRGPLECSALAWAPDSSHRCGSVSCHEIQAADLPGALH